MCVGLLPPTGTGKINTDGSSHGDPGEAGIGGLIRDSGGCWGLVLRRELAGLPPLQLNCRAF
jgi:hypothetical protein